jgi:ribose transport system substrate-binding protein
MALSLLSFLIVLAGCTSHQSATKLPALSSTPLSSSSAVDRPVTQPPVNVAAPDPPNANVAALAVAEKGRFTHPPTAPSPAVHGGTVWMIASNVHDHGMRQAVAAAKEAATSLGWGSTVYDTKGLPGNFTSGVLAAIKARAKGIVLVGIDCAYVKSQLAAAERAHVLVTAIDGLDCSETSPGQPSLFTAGISFGTRWTDFSGVLRQQGSDLAAFIGASARAAGPPAQAAMIESVPDYADELRGGGFVAGMKYQGGVSIDYPKIDWTLQAGGYNLFQAVTSEVAQRPKLAALGVTSLLYADNVTSLRQITDKTDRGLVMADSGGNIDELRMIGGHEGLDASMVWPWEWWGYAAIDSLNSALAHRPLRDEGLGYQLATPDNVNRILGEVSQNSWDGASDFRAVYLRSWGTK